MDEKVLRFPARHLEVFAYPSLPEMGGMVEANRALLAGCDYLVAGRPARSIRMLARREALATLGSGPATAGLRSTREGAARPEVDRREDSPARGDACYSAKREPIIATGHQPELFHPGVWIKNHFVSALAKSVGGVSLNVIMDSDTVKQRSLLVPVRDRERIVGLSVPLCRCERGVLLEAAGLDGDLVKTSLRRVEGALRPRECGGMAETFARFGECARAVLPDCGTLSEFLWRSRSLFEQDWGLRNLELPVSRLCGTDAFLHFVVWLAQERERFRLLHNERLREHRRAKGIRTGAQPAPDLGLAGDACELPFWTVRGSGRRRLWGARAREGLTLMDDEGDLVVLGEDAFADLRRAVDGGVRLRPRAITNSLFVRLFVADVFVHGIGGGKYDTVTDAIARDFVGIEPPAFAVLSATALLPFTPHDESEGDLRRTQRLLRDTFWNAGRFVSEEDPARGEVGRLLEEKRRLAAGMREAEKGERRRRYERIHEINGLLSRRAARAREELGRQLQRIQRMLEENAIMSNRDYPFVLYPRETLDQLYSFDLG